MSDLPSLSPYSQAGPLRSDPEPRSAEPLSGSSWSAAYPESSPSNHLRSAPPWIARPSSSIAPTSPPGNDMVVTLAQYVNTDAIMEGFMSALSGLRADLQRENRDRIEREAKKYWNHEMSVKLEVMLQELLPFFFLGQKQEIQKRQDEADARYQERLEAFEARREEWQADFEEILRVRHNELEDRYEELKGGLAAAQNPAIQHEYDDVHTARQQAEDQARHAQILAAIEKMSNRLDDNLLAMRRELRTFKETTEATLAKLEASCEDSQTCVQQEVDEMRADMTETMNTILDEVRRDRDDIASRSQSPILARQQVEWASQPRSPVLTQQLALSQLAREAEEGSQPQESPRSSGSSSQDPETLTRLGLAAEAAVEASLPICPWSDDEPAHANEPANADEPDHVPVQLDNLEDDDVDMTYEAAASPRSSPEPSPVEAWTEAGFDIETTDVLEEPREATPLRRESTPTPREASTPSRQSSRLTSLIASSPVKPESQDTKPSKRALDAVDAPEKKKGKRRKRESTAKLPVVRLKKGDNVRRGDGVWPSFPPKWASYRMQQQEIQCDQCRGWAHWACAGLKLDVGELDCWVCPDCEVYVANDGIDQIKPPSPDHCIRHTCIRRRKLKIVVEDGDEDRWLVEKIIGRRKLGTETQHLILWENYPVEDCTWEPLANLAVDRNGKYLHVEEFERAVAQLGRQDQLASSKIFLLPEAVPTWDPKSGELAE